MIQTKAMSYWTRKENYQILHLEIILSQELKKFQSEIVSLFPEVRKSIHILHRSIQQLDYNKTG